ncbi:MAG TPA: TIGR01777 family oxidoreductase [Candidatus Limnocylindria bacterium]|nr:TIGR01777 family oxidoreductase [Candidatus Limnocylindria bacterium]
MTRSRVLVSGSHGLVGTALIAHLEAAGRPVTRLVRRAPRDAAEREWRPESGPVDLSGLELDAVVHLAGANLAAGRWTPRQKALLRSSRIEGTRRLAAAVASLDPLPRVWISASAVGLYGDRGEEQLTETSAPGSGFLPDLVQEWESAAAPIVRAGVRVVWLRFGMVLAPQGGALAKLLPPFRLGIGGPFGSGRQWWNWISRPDLIAVIDATLNQATLSGVVNAVAPGCVRNREFARVLGRVLGRPAFLTVPAAALRLLLGREMADETLLSSGRVEPRRLMDAGFRFADPELEGALRHVLARPSRA